MADKAWKAFERRVAKFFSGPNGQRNPGSGGFSLSQTKTKADVIHPDLFIECKQRVRHSVVRIWDKAQKDAKKEDKPVVVALSEKGRRGFWIMVHSDDFDKVKRSI
jgi:hypothetical protein